MSRWLAAVKRAITRNKRVCTYITKTKAGYDPTTGTNAVTETSTPFEAARDTARKSQSTGTSIILVDKTVFYIAGDTLVPKVNDIIQDGTEKFTIDKVEKNFAGGEVVMYVAVCNS